ncbi:hypothetical protein HNR23_001019 [Nocardiopsis mwathae]|uniref:DNA-binding domain-containing protein n=1 Tax=Nocardiopsis mwathae TaxID=1472723 RepID=A0A7X0D5B5_9ACTN|nr:hypothetical protein [Nocardiopsis mwathae]
MAHTTHANAKLAPAGRLALARCIVEDGWPLRRAAERFQVSPTTAQRWSDRSRTLGQAGMTDASSRPARSPRSAAGRRGAPLAAERYGDASSCLMSVGDRRARPACSDTRPWWPK